MKDPIGCFLAVIFLSSLAMLSCTPHDRKQITEKAKVFCKCSGGVEYIKFVSDYTANVTCFNAKTKKINIHDYIGDCNKKVDKY